MSKVADSKLNAVTFDLLPGEEEVLEVLVRWCEKYGTRHFELRHRSDVKYYMVVAWGSDEESLPGDREEVQSSYLAGLDELGFLAYGTQPWMSGAGKPPGAGKAGMEVGDSVTVLPSAVLRVKHRERGAFGQWVRVRWLEFREHLAVAAFVVSLLSVAISLASLVLAFLVAIGLLGI